MIVPLHCTGNICMWTYYVFVSECNRELLFLLVLEKTGISQSYYQVKIFRAMKENIFMHRGIIMLRFLDVNSSLTF